MIESQPLVRRKGATRPDDLSILASKLARIQDFVLEQSGCGLTYRNFRVMVRITEGRDSLTKLGASATTTYSAISQALQAVSSKGLVSRAPSAGDKRATTLAVTPKGLSALETARQALDEFVDQLVATLDEEEEEKLWSSLSKILTNLDELAVGMGLRPADRARGGIT